jgi:hypothetical protein
MRKEGLAALVVILVVASLGVGYLSGNYTRTTETTTSVSTAAVTYELTTTSKSTLTSVSTYTFVSFSTAQFAGLPWTSVFFVTSGGMCNGICFGDLGGAVIFSCPTATANATATTPVTCSIITYSTIAKTNMSIVATFPEYNQTNELAADNCGVEGIWLPSNTPLFPGQEFGYCLQIGSNAFVIAEQEPPPA